MAGPAIRVGLASDHVGTADSNGSNHRLPPAHADCLLPRRGRVHQGGFIAVQEEDGVRMTVILWFFGRAADATAVNLSYPQVRGLTCNPFLNRVPQVRILPGAPR
jgi:hypothetical protein